MKVVDSMKSSHNRLVGGSNPSGPTIQIANQGRLLKSPCFPLAEAIECCLLEMGLLGTQWPFLFSGSGSRLADSSLHIIIT
jgi:hypothetical protein